MQDLKKTIPNSISYTNENLIIHWKDGYQSSYNLLELRKKCPCATCRGGHGGKIGATTSHLTVANIISWTKVGRYAINIVWNDYHNTGIYSFDNLRAFSEGIVNDLD